MELKDEIYHRINHVNETKDQHELVQSEDILNDYAKNNKNKFYFF